MATTIPPPCTPYNRRPVMCSECHGRAWPEPVPDGSPQLRCWSAPTQPCKLAVKRPGSEKEVQ
jgi:hypothetical protein